MCTSQAMRNYKNILIIYTFFVGYLSNISLGLHETIYNDTSDVLAIDASLHSKCWISSQVNLCDGHLKRQMKKDCYIYLHNRLNGCSMDSCTVTGFCLPGEQNPVTTTLPTYTRTECNLFLKPTAERSSPKGSRSKKKTFMTAFWPEKNKANKEAKLHPVFTSSSPVRQSHIMKKRNNNNKDEKTCSTFSTTVLCFLLFVWIEFTSETVLGLKFYRQFLLPKLSHLFVFWFAHIS